MITPSLPPSLPPTAVSTPAAPEILTPPETVFAELYSSVLLMCETTGSPQPTVQWFRDGVAIPNERSSRLTIPSVLLSDRGQYYCTATNSEGSTQSDVAYINVIGMEFVLCTVVIHV